MRIRLTDLAIKKLALPVSGQVTHWDQTTPGFGLRCSTRSKSYVVMFGEKRRLKTLGRHPALSLADARKRARTLLLAQSDPASVPLEHDYKEVLDEYLQDCHRRLRASTIGGYELYLNSFRFSGPVSNIKQSDVLRAIGRHTASPSSQNYAFTTFKVFFNWLVRRQYLASNPLAALKRPNKAYARDRVLNDGEVRILLQYCQSNRDRFNDIVALLLLTGQRRSEIAGLQWSEVNGDLMRLGPDRTKNKHEHVVPLPATAMELLQSIDGGPKYVFGMAELDQPFKGWSRAQRRIIADTDMNHFTLHDLRRTFATQHAKIGTPIHVTERLLNHRSGSISGVAAVYNRHSYTDEMRTAMATYDDHLAKLTSGC